MARNTLFLVLGICLAMYLLWRMGAEPEAERVNSVSVEEPEQLPATPPPERRQATPVATPPQTLQEVVELQRRLTEEREKRDAQVRVLRDLQRRRQELSRTPSYSVQIEAHDLEIQNLLDVLSFMRDAEDQLARAVSQRLQRQENAARAARDQVDLQIQRVEQSLRNTQNELSYLKNFAFGIDVNQLNARTQELQNQLANLQGELESLQSQRAELSLQTYSGMTETYALADQAREELQESVAITQDQIFSLRSEIDRLQGVQYRTQHNMDSWRSQIGRQISQVETELQNLNQVIQSLEKEISEKQRAAR